MDIKHFRSHYDPGVDSASNRNEYQEHFLRVKSGRCVRLTTVPPSCAVVTKSGNLNFLEPSGLFWACNGTEIRKNEIGRACSTMGVTGEVHTGFWWGDLKKRGHEEDTGVDGMTLLKWIFKN